MLMKNYKKFVAVFVFAALLFTFNVTGVKAETGAGVDASVGGSAGTTIFPGVKKPVQVQGTADASLTLRARAELDAAFTKEKTRCEAIQNSEERKVCMSKIETSYKAAKARLESVRTEDRSDDRPEDRIEKRESKMLKFENNVENVLRRLGAMFERLTRIGDRIEARIKLLSADKIDTSVSMKYLTAAREDLRNAKSAIDSAYEMFKTERAAASVSVNVSSKTSFEKCKAAGGIILKTFPAQCKIGNETYVDADASLRDSSGSSVNSGPSNPVKESFEKTRALIKTAKEHLKAAHADLVNSIKSLKPGLNKPSKIEASGTVNTTTTVNN